MLLLPWSSDKKKASPRRKPGKSSKTAPKRRVKGASSAKSSASSGKPPRKAWVRLLRVAIGLGGFGFLMLLLLIGLVWAGVFGAIPSTSELRTTIATDDASLVIAADGSIMGKYYRTNRQVIPVDNLPPHLLDALVATEDARFYEHKGVDRWSLGRVFLKTILLRDRSAGGGSTISQQLAKNLYPRKNHGLLNLPVAKIWESIAATRFERVYEKTEILELYLNTVPFGENIYGIEAASLRFFDKPATQLKVEEGAVLIGLLKANTAYNPRLNPERSQHRRNVVLSQMTKYGYLSSTEYDSLKQVDIELHYRTLGVHEGVAPYFRNWVRRQADEALKGLTKENGEAWNIETDGLRIYTTIDPELQKYADQSVREHLAKLQAHFAKDRSSRLRGDALSKAKAGTVRGQRGSTAEAWTQKRDMEIYTPEGMKTVQMSPEDSLVHYEGLLKAGFLVTDPRSGNILAWVGGPEHRYFPYDHVTSRRQAGSTFKPVVFASALEAGKDPCEYIAAAREEYEDYNDWSPRNAGGAYEGYWSMAGALAKSVNTVAVKLFVETGPEEVARHARDLGLEDGFEEETIYPSSALGTGTVSAFDLAEAYSAFQSGGKRRPLNGLLKIEDRNGEVIWEALGRDMPTQVLGTRTSELMTRMMQMTVDSGTARSLRTVYRLQGDIAGKTGTTQDHSDGWFVGYTPNMLAVAWVGADNPGLHFSNLNYGQGASMALPIWGKFMHKAQRDRSYKSWAIDSFHRFDPAVDRALHCNNWVEEIPEPSFWEMLFGPGRKDRKKDFNINIDRREDGDWIIVEPEPKEKKRRRDRPRRRDRNRRRSG